MLGYLLRRILAAVPVMGVVALFVFLLLRLTPGDPAAILAGGQRHAGAARAHPHLARAQ
ncbi:ABC-type dipeptide/oligopeptide/nickel transport system permease component [Bradyrhizobium sp. GM2.4]